MLGLLGEYNVRTHRELKRQKRKKKVMMKEVMKETVLVIGMFEYE